MKQTRAAGGKRGKTRSKGESSSPDAKATEAAPPLKPRKRALIVLAAVMAVWIVLLLLLYLFTV